MPPNMKPFHGVITKNRLILSIVFLIILATTQFLKEVEVISATVLNTVLVIELLAINCILLIKCISKKNMIFTSYYFFILLYSIKYVQYFFLGAYISFHQIGFRDDASVRDSMLCLLIFLLISFLLHRIQNNAEPLRGIKAYKSSILFYTNAAIMLIIIIFANQRTSILTTGSYGASISSNISSFNDYFIVFLLGAFIFTSQNRLQKNILTVLIIMYIAKNILTGGRIEAVMTLLLILSVFLSNKISYKTFGILGVLGIVFFIAVGVIRQDVSSGFDSLKGINFIELLSPNYRNIIPPSTEGDIIYASQRMHMLINQGYLSSTERLYSMVYFFASIIVPSRFLPDLAVIQSYKTEVYSTGGGGLFTSQMFVYAGLTGVILCGVFIIYVLNQLAPNSRQLKSRVSNFLLFYSLLAASTFPRWFGYSAIIFFKLCLLGALYLALLTSLKNSNK